jgi:hypothetical protein
MAVEWLGEERRQKGWAGMTGDVGKAGRTAGQAVAAIFPAPIRIDGPVVAQGGRATGAAPPGAVKNTAAAVEITGGAALGTRDLLGGLKDEFWTQIDQGIGSRLIDTPPAPAPAPLPGVVGKVASPIVGAAAALGKGISAAEKAESGDMTGAGLDLTGYFAQGTKAGLETVTGLGGGKLGPRGVESLGAAGKWAGVVGDAAGGASTYLEGHRGQNAALENLAASRTGTRLLLDNAARLDDRSLYFRHQADMNGFVRSDAGKKLLEDLRKGATE